MATDYAARSEIVTIRLRPDEHRRLRALARADDRSVSNLVRRAIVTVLDAPRQLESFFELAFHRRR